MGNGGHKQLTRLCCKAFLKTKNIRPGIWISPVRAALQVKIEPADVTALPLPDSSQALASVSYLSLSQGAEREMMETSDRKLKVE